MRHLLQFLLLHQDHACLNSTLICGIECLLSGSSQMTRFIILFMFSVSVPYLIVYLYSQAINVVDNRLFRDWALYGRNNLTEHDLPHRTRLLEMIFEEYENEHRNTLSDFQVSHFVLCSSTITCINLNLVSHWAYFLHFGLLEQS